MMPTGYTHDIYEGKPVTFKQFALKCSRAMGAAILQREDDPDVEIKLREVDHYLSEQITKAEKALVVARALTDDEWAKKQRTEFEADEKSRTEYVEKKKAAHSRYWDMRLKVMRWVPPTADHHGLKGFMLEQLDSSIKFDCGSYEPDKAVMVPTAEFKAKKLDHMAKDFGRATTNLHEEIVRVRGQNEWVTALRDSLKKAAK